MIIQALAFYLFAAVAVASGVMVVSARNPVHSVLFLILAFFNAAALFVLMGAEFLAMVLVIVYVGAVAVLFLFVVMMLDINFVALRQGFQQYLPVGALVGLVLVAELVLVVRSREAVEAIVEHQGKLGADLEITVGTVGGGMEGAVTSNLGADLIVFSRSAGLFAGGSIEGAVLARRNDYNQAFYGPGATPQAILFGQGLANPHADGLRKSLLLN